MRYPEFLKSGGTIGFVAPSFGCNMEPYKSAFDRAQKKFQNLGYQLKLGENCYAGEGIGISNTPKKCGEELTQHYCSQESDILISCGGGEMMCEILDFVDFEAVKKAAPKWYMGFSDNTNMTFLLTTLCDTASIYGPGAPAFGMEPWHPALFDAMEILQGKKNRVEGYPLWERESKKDEAHPYEPYNVTEPKKLRSFRPLSLTDRERAEMTLQPMKEAEADERISMKGRLLGGCMDCLVNLLGTKYDKVEAFDETYKEDGIIWFLESCDLNVMSIRRAMWQMEHAGWFRHVKGFLIGRPLCFGEEMMGLNQYHAVYDIIAKYQVPVVMDVDFGHLAPMMPIVCGSIGEVMVKNHDISITMQYR